jgi:hypothetical protein
MAPNIPKVADAPKKKREQVRRRGRRKCVLNPEEFMRRVIALEAWEMRSKEPLKIDM